MFVTRLDESAYKHHLETAVLLIKMVVDTSYTDEKEKREERRLRQKEKFNGIK